MTCRRAPTWSILVSSPHRVTDSIGSVVKQHAWSIAHQENLDV